MDGTGGAQVEGVQAASGGRVIRFRDLGAVRERDFGVNLGGGERGGTLPCFLAEWPLPEAQAAVAHVRAAVYAGEGGSWVEC